MTVPLLDLKAQYRTIRDEVRAVMDDVCDAQYFIMGPKVEAFEKAVAAYSGAKFAVGVSSGTDALLIALMALDIRSGDEVITSPFTFFATAGVIHRLHAKPVFVDIDPLTFNIDPAKIEAAITPRTKAILPVHLFGQMADMDPIMILSRRRHIPVIEDGAQSIGAEYKGRRCGSIGDLGCFSFFPSKNLGAFGDAGMVLTNDSAIYDKLKLLRVHGAPSTYFHKFVGGNFRLDALQAAILNVKLKYLEGWSDGRKKNAAYYDKAFADAGLTAPTSSRPTPPIQPPPAVYRQGGDRHDHIYNQYTLRAKDRDKLQAHLKSKSIGCAVYYPLPLHLQECFAPLGCPAGTFPVAERAAAEVISLPIYPELTDEMKAYVVDSVAEFYK
jgi:dTDP-4-amino-4,6-dideoxygalactose transaminase